MNSHRQVEFGIALIATIELSGSRTSVLAIQEVLIESVDLYYVFS